ncbi:MAG: hypothetical protein AAF724_02070 [Pseudomonadota bacterium]
MTKVELDQEEEKPLDPAMEKVRRKMVRLLVVSIGIMFLGVMAVLAGVVYRVMEPDETQRAAQAGLAQPAIPASVTASLPAGFSVENVALDGTRILFFGRTVDGTSSAVILDLSTGDIVTEIELR